MTTDSFANDAVARMMQLRQGKATGRAFTAKPGSFQWKWFHLALAGVGKVGKSHLGLSARTHEIREPDSVDAKFKRTPGAILIPSKPLSVAYANFDRPVDTVLDNLPEDSHFYEEIFYLNDDGEVLHPLELKEADFQKLYLKLDEFVRSSIQAGFDLCHIDGGTIIWEHVRRWRLPPPPKDKDSNVPNQYGPANQTMRVWMQRLYSSQIHSLVSMEARELWQSASGPVVGSSGKPLMKPDGWGKTDHYSDMQVLMELKDRRGSDGSLKPTRVGTISQSLKLELEGRTIDNPTYADLFKLNYGHPLLLRSDFDDYNEMLAQHPKLSWG